MCHTDMVARDRLYTVPMPVVLGHEGASVVERVGADVKKLAPGDHVVLAYMWCGHCNPYLNGNLTYCANFSPLNFGGVREDGSMARHDKQGAVHDHFFGQSPFGTFVLAHERNAIKAAATAQFGTARAARLRHPDRRGRRDERIKGEARQQIRGVRRRRFHARIERSAVLRQAIDALAMCGVCGIVGALALGTKASFDVNGVMTASKRIIGIIEGDSVPDLFIPSLVELYQQGRFPFDKLVKFSSLDQINQAAEDSEKGVTIKPIVRLGVVTTQWMHELGGEDARCLMVLNRNGVIMRLRRPALPTITLLVMSLGFFGSAEAKTVEAGDATANWNGTGVIDDLGFREKVFTGTITGTMFIRQPDTCTDPRSEN